VGEHLRFDPHEARPRARFGATQWTMTGWQKTMSPGSPVNSTTRRGTPSTVVSLSMKAAIRSAGDGACPVSAMSQG
jgi:hypothetical protein